MRAEILKALEKKLRGAQLDQPELLAVTRELQAILGYAQKRQELWDMLAQEYDSLEEWANQKGAPRSG